VERDGEERVGGGQVGDLKLCMYNFGARAWQPWTNGQTMVWIGEVWRHLVQLRYSSESCGGGRWCGWIRREIMYRVHFSSHRSVKMYSVKDVTAKVNSTHHGTIYTVG
jgi:hypothetical protein